MSSYHQTFPLEPAGNKTYYSHLEFSRWFLYAALSLATHLEIENQSNSGTGVLKRDGFTSRGFNAFSPWIDSKYPKSLLQIYLSYNALALMDVLNLGVLSNFSRDEFYFNAYRDQRYHVEKQPQFVDEVASNTFFSINAGLSRLKSPIFDLPPHQTSEGKFILILDYLGTYKYKI